MRRVLVPVRGRVCGLVSVTDTGVRQPHVRAAVLRGPLPALDDAVRRPLFGELSIGDVRDVAAVRAVLSVLLLAPAVEVLRALSGQPLSAAEDE